MKKIIPFLAMLIIFASCVKNSSKETTTKENSPGKVEPKIKEVDPTTKLITFIESYKDRDRGVNEIMRNELYLEREKKVTEYTDSFLVFKNFKGKISDIKNRSNNEHSFKIAYKIEVPFIKNNHGYMTFFCENIIENKKVNSDYLYNKIKSMPENSTVYFDGFIAIDRNKKLPIDRNTSTSLIFAFPYYNFHALDISSVNELPDTLSPNLRKTMLLGQKECEHIVRKWQKKKTSSKDYEKIYAELKKLKGNLTLQELEYYERYTDAYTDDLVKSGR